jgi:hypothetical protein
MQTTFSSFRSGASRILAGMSRGNSYVGLAGWPQDFDRK